MDGVKFARIIEQLLSERGIKKGDFYSEIGITATAFYGWKRGAEPKRETVEAVEKYFGVSLDDETPAAIDPDTAELLDSIRNRPDLGILLRSARDVPASSVYSLVAQLEKLKEDSNN